MFCIIIVLLCRTSGYPSMFWHFNSLTSPGPGLTLQNNPTITPTGTLLLDSNYPYGRVDSNFVFGGDSTFIARVFPVSCPLWSRILDFGTGPGTDNFLIGMDDVYNAVLVHVYQGGSQSTSYCSYVYTSNQWNIIIVSVTNQGVINIYGNGVLFCTLNVYSIPTVSRGSQFIAKSNWASDPSWMGEIDFLWYLPRVVTANEVTMINVDSEMMGNAWTFQSPSALDSRLSLLSSSDVSSGTLNLHGDNNQGAAIIQPLSYTISGPTSFAARVYLNSYTQWGRVVDFSSSTTNDGVLFSQMGVTGNGFFGVYRGGAQNFQNSMACNSFWQLGSWVDVAVTVTDTTAVMYRNGNAMCVGNVWMPLAVPRNWGYIGKSRESVDAGWDGSFQWVMHWNRSLVASEVAYITAARNTLSPAILTHFSSTSFDPLFSGSATLNGATATFSGIQYVQVDSSFRISSPLTVAMLVWMNSFQNNCRLMDFANGANIDNFAIGMDGTSNTIRLIQGSTTVLSCSNFFSLNHLTELALTHDGYTATFYMDGAAVCNGPVPSVPSLTRSLQYIGKSTNSGDSGFNGYIDYFMVFNRALSPVEVAAITPAWDRYFTTCAAVIPSDPRVNMGSCVGYGKLASTCQLSCAAGYVPLNAVNGICTTVLPAERAVWMGQALTCVSQCPVLTPPKNGTQSCNGIYGAYYEGSVCSFTCSAGFIAVGSVTTACTQQGTWTAPTPACAAVPCPTPAVQYGNATCSGPFGLSNYLASCTFGCQIGFSLSGATNATCKVNGTWSYPFPSCIPQSCPALILPNGNVLCANPYGGSWTVGSTCTSACLTNYSMTIVGSTTAVASATTTCNSSLAWSPRNASNLVCNLVVCQTLTNPARGNITCDSGIFNVNFGVTSKCQSSCLSGFQLSGNGTQECLNSGSWSVIQSTCVDIDECSTSTPCPTGSKCGNLIGSYYCSPTFLTPVTGVISGTSQLSSTMGAQVTFTLSTGTNVDLVLTQLSFIMNPLNPASTLSNCTNIGTTPLSATTMNVLCTIGPGLGAGLTLTLRYVVRGNQTTGTVNSPTFSYPGPFIQSGTLRLLGDVGSTHIVSVNYTTGDIISFDGSGFLPNSLLLTVTYGPPFSTLQSPCTLILGMCTTIVVYTFNCNLPAGTGFNRTVVLAADGKYSQPRNLISYAAPVINDISGCTPSPDNQLAVTQCTRQGGDTLIVDGSNFGADGSSVSIGGVRCTSTVHDPSNPHTRVVCTTPPGYGLARQVQLFQSAGPFSEEDATLDYTQCDVGDFQDGTKTTCGICIMGQYTNTVGQLVCLSCDPGRYTPNGGSATCLPCPAGTSQPSTGMSACIECDPGFYAIVEATVSCLACDPGTNATYSGSTSCTPCPLGAVSQKNGAAGPTSCVECDMGYFSGSTQQVVCQICPAGKYSPSQGSSACVDCSPGFYQSAQGQGKCLPCSPGSYTSVDGRSECLPCDSGTATNNYNATSCGVCAPGTVSKRDLESIVGPTQCAECAEGTFMATSGQAVCIGCSPGTHADGPGMTECLQCSPGYYQSNSSAPECAPCPLGSYAALSGRPECLLCGSGSRSNVTAAVACTQCEPGSYSTTASGAGVTACTLCTPGTYTNTWQQVSCLQCAVGTYSSSSGAVSCLSCPPGTSGQDGGARGCIVCDPGRYSGVSGQASCTLCPTGKYAPFYNASTCLDCNEGLFQTYFGSSYCSLCGPGRFSSVKGRDTCTPCSPGGYTAANGSSTCADCPRGTFQANSGSSVCQTCDSGTYNTFVGQVACVLCPAGRYSNTSNQTQCLPCPAGYAQGQMGRTECTICDPGKFTPPGGSYCLTCATGLVASQPGSIECGFCQPNSMVDKTQSNCNCNPGFYLQQASNSSQKMTTTNNTSTNAGSGTCVPCPVGTVCNQYGTVRDSIPTQDGYYLTEADTLTYQKCLSPKSCVAGHCVNNRMGPLCATCKPGYSMSDWTKGCAACASRKSSVAATTLTILGLLLAVVLLYAYIIYSALTATKTIQFANNNISPVAFNLGGDVKSQTDIQRQRVDDSGSSIQPGNTQRSPLSSSAAATTAGSIGSSAGVLNLERIGNLDSSAEAIQKLLTPVTDKKHASDNTYVFKIWVNFFQVASSLITLPAAGAIAFPTYYMEFLSYFKFFNIDFIPWQNVGCIIPLNFYTKLVVTTLVPLVIIIVLGIVIGVVTLVLDARDMDDNDQGRVRRQKIRCVYVRSVIFTMFMLYPKVSSTVLSHFVCLQVGRQTILIADFSIMCYSGVWHKWTPYAVIMTVIYPVGVPMLFFFLLYKNRNNLFSPFASLGLGFLHESYVPGAWWFEVLVMVQKLTLTSLLQFLPLEIQMGGGVAVAAAFLVTIVLLQPEIRLRNWLLHMLANVEIVMLLLLWHFSYRENITQAPVAINASISALFIVLTVLLTALLFLDILRWVKDKVFGLIRTARSNAG